MLRGGSERWKVYLPVRRGAGCSGENEEDELGNGGANGSLIGVRQAQTFDAAPVLWRRFVWCCSLGRRGRRRAESEKRIKSSRSTIRRNEDAPDEFCGTFNSSASVPPLVFRASGQFHGVDAGFVSVSKVFRFPKTHSIIPCNPYDCAMRPKKRKLLKASRASDGRMIEESRRLREQAAATPAA